MTQLESMLEGYVKRSEFRRLRKKVEGEGQAECTSTINGVNEHKLEQLIAAQKGPYEAVEAGMLMLFTLDEINAHSATCKKPNKAMPAKSQKNVSQMRADTKFSPPLNK